MKSLLTQPTGEKLVFDLDALNFRRSALATVFTKIMKTCQLAPEYWTEKLGFSNRLLEEESVQLEMEGKQCLPGKNELRAVLNEAIDKFPVLQKEHDAPVPLEKIRHIFYKYLLIDVLAFKKRILMYLLKEELPLAAYFIRVYLTAPKQFTTLAIHSGRKEPNVEKVCPVCKSNYISSRRKFCSEECKKKLPK